jgi:hypothetical protein
MTTLEEITNEAAYMALEKNNPKMLALVTGLVDKGETPSRIGKVLKSRGQTSAMVYTVECAAAHYVQIRKSR